MPFLKVPPYTLTPLPSLPFTANPRLIYPTFSLSMFHPLVTTGSSTMVPSLLPSFP